MKLLLLFLLILFSSLNQAVTQENLIPNPSFEELNECHDTIPVYIENAKQWYSFIWNPDLYHSCMGNGYRTNGVPLNADYCFQEPKSGDGYAGIKVYTTVGSSSGEFLGVPVKSEINKGANYFIRFYVSARNCQDNWSLCFIDGMGLAFSDSIYQIGQVSGGDYPAQDLFNPVIENERGKILNDTAGWTKISGCYTGQGWEKSILIGNFLKWEETMVGYCGTAAYYYIDDVGVFEFDPLPDTMLICSNEEIRLGSKFLDARYQWNTGATDSVIIVSDAGEYIVDVIMDDCILSDTVYVVNNDQELADLFTDTSFCEDDGYLSIEIPLPGEYDWSNDLQESSQVQVMNGGIFSFTLTNACGQFSHSFNVSKEYCDIYIPNTFTPNGDNINDVFKPLPNSSFVQLQSIRIYDRWGSLIHESGNEVRWDGTYNGIKLSQGVYVYFISYLSDGHLKEKRGTVSLVR